MKSVLSWARVGASSEPPSIAPLSCMATRTGSDFTSVVDVYLSPSKLRGYAIRAVYVVVGVRSRGLDER